MSELTEFILERVAEDEEVARAAVVPAWGGDYKPHPEYAEWFVGDTGEVEYLQTPEALAHKYPDRLYVTCDGEGLTPSVDAIVAAHIARHDPARVLAECEAKRAIVALHSGPQYGHPDAHLCYDSMTPDDRCDTTRALAAVYAGHESFKEEWRP